MRGSDTRGGDMIFGDFGLRATSSGWISSKQIEAARKVLTRYTQKGGRVWIRIFPHKPISDKPAEVRMGGGKGDVVDHVAVVKPGRILYELGAGVTEDQAREALQKASSKLPVHTKFAKKGQL